MSPPDREPPPAAQRYQVFGVPAGGDQEEQLLKSFDRAFEAAAFAKLVSAGGRYHRVRVETPASSREQDRPRRALSDEQQLRSRPGWLFKLLYAGTLLGGGLLSLVLGFAGAFFLVIWLSTEAGLPLGPGVVLPIAVAFAAGLTALVVKLHAALFRERGENSESRTHRRRTRPWRH
jgi:hypothetical protein